MQRIDANVRYAEQDDANGVAIDDRVHGCPRRTKGDCMSQPAGTLVHPITKDQVAVFSGFSWPCFFAGCFWYVAKGLWGMGILAFLIAVVTSGLAWFVFPFFANDQYRKSLLNDGYLPEDQVCRSPLTVQGSVADEIRKLAELKASGALTEEEFSTRKSRLLGA